jgi:Oxidoreductase family, NAD-binding Rossmann fold
VKALRVGIIGTGFIAKTRVDSFRRACLIFPEVTTSVSIDAVADVALEPAQAFARAMSIGGAVDDWRPIVDDPAIDLIDIAAPNNLHFPIAMVAAERRQVDLLRKAAGADVGGSRRDGGGRKGHRRADLRCIQQRLRASRGSVRRWPESSRP